MAKKKRLTKFEMECMEREARGRAAWGAFAAYQRQASLNEECKKLHRELSHLSEREREEKIKEFQRNKSSGGMYIG